MFISILFQIRQLSEGHLFCLNLRSDRISKSDRSSSGNSVLRVVSGHPSRSKISSLVQTGDQFPATERPGSIKVWVAPPEWSLL